MLQAHTKTHSSAAFITFDYDLAHQILRRGLKALWQYLQVAGQDVEGIKAKIKSIVIKTIIASVPTVTSLSKSHCKYRHTCHELFGFDIFLDQHLKPWLIEVSAENYLLSVSCTTDFH
jgi:hypothetical protein